MWVFCLYMYMSIYMSGQHMFAPPSQGAEEGVSSLGTGVRDSFHLFCRCWDSNPVPWKEQQVLLSTKALQPPK